MKNTKIEWADDTENFAGGCSEAKLKSGKMDPACVNCYARLQSARAEAMVSAAARVSIYTGVANRSGNTATWTGRLTWDRDLMRRRFQSMRGGYRVFIGSMTDLWHADHDPALLVALAEEIRTLGKRPPEKRPHLITLTKRADRLLAWQREHFPEGLPSYVWPGVTAGCQEAANERIPLLLQVRADGPRVVSVEPMTGPMVLFESDATDPGAIAGPGVVSEGAQDRETGEWFGSTYPGIGWVIAGGESGAKARPSRLDWFRSLRDQCVAAGVPFHFKQWGEWAPDYYVEDDDPPGTPPRQAAESMSKVGKHNAGRLLDGRTWDEVPHV